MQSDHPLVRGTVGPRGLGAEPSPVGQDYLHRDGAGKTGLWHAAQGPGNQRITLPLQRLEARVVHVGDEGDGRLILPSIPFPAAVDHNVAVSVMLGIQAHTGQASSYVGGNRAFEEGNGGTGPHPG